MENCKPFGRLMRLLALFLFGLSIWSMPIVITSCNEGVDSVLNYPGSTITNYSYEDGTYCFELRYVSELSGKFAYKTIKVSKFEYEHFNVGDTIPDLKPKHK